MINILQASCVACGTARAFDLTLTVCPACGHNLDLRYDYPAVAGQLSRASLARDPDLTLWRYAPLLPVSRPATVLPVGWTPLLPAPGLARALGLTGDLWLKDEGRNPSGSLKDRASAVVLAGALQAGVTTVVGASTGNAGSSMACLAASAGLTCVIFVPAAAPEAKVAQLLAFGAQVVAVDGSYDQAFDLSLQVGKQRGWYSRSTGFNPLTREGKKTCALEIWEQLGCRVPDWVFVSVGDGNIISGLHKGFSDLVALDLADRLPRLGAVQSTGSAAVVRTLQALGPGTRTPAAEIVIEPVRASSIADSICVDRPRDGLAAVRAVQESCGLALQVEDEEILQAIPLTARSCGVFGEPAGVACVAGLRLAVEQGQVGAGQSVVCVITGSGLKDARAALRATRMPEPIPPTIEAALAASL